MQEMGKVVRNTIFTVLVVFSTAVAIGWNRQVAHYQQPIAIGQEVLTSPTVVAGDSQLSLSLELGRDVVKLGQSQEIRISTVPHAQLDIVVVYPDGQVNSPHTHRAEADEVGRYQYRFKLSDFRHLGIFEVKVRSMLGTRASQTSAKFALESWAYEKPANDYLYPLIP